MAQEVHVSRDSNGVALGVMAQEPYKLLAGNQKMPGLLLDCAQRGKKSEHHLSFFPGGPVLNYDSRIIADRQPPLFYMTINGTRTLTVWTAYRDMVSFTYSARTEKERMKFIQSLLDSVVVSIEFAPQVGLPTTSTFDLSKLRTEINNYPECTVK